MDQLPRMLLEISTWIIPALLAITLHEAAHGFVADRLGDPTARLAGRLSLNPFRHIDPFGTVLLPGLLLLMHSPFLFGYAKPVPVNFRQLRHPRRDMALVAAAGPLTNLAIAIVAALLIRPAEALPYDAYRWVFANLFNAIQLNVILAVFNLLPIPPLDGGRVLVAILPPSLARPLASLERLGIVIVLLFLFLIPRLGSQFGLNLPIDRWLVAGPVEAVRNAILGLAGF
ncbi:MAG: site-2 protease family protein [Rhodospirillales bacterium]